MIGPGTRVFGLVTADPEDGWLAHLFNYLFGFNGLDAAYVNFLVRPDVLATTLTGLVRSGRTEAVHVAPSHWEAAAAWRGAGQLIDTIDIAAGAARPSFAHARHLAGLLTSTLPPRFSAAVFGAGPLAREIVAALAGSGARLTFAGPPAGGAAGLVHAARDAGLDAAATTEEAIDPAAHDVTIDALLPARSAIAFGRGAPRVAAVAAASWRREPARLRADVAAWPTSALWAARACAEIRERFGVDPRVPGDLDAAVREPQMRPCKMTDDHYEEHYGTARAAR